MEVQQQSTLRQRLIAIIITGVGEALATAVSFGMALYEAAHPEADPVIAAGKPIDTGRWIVTVREQKSLPYRQPAQSRWSRRRS